MKLSVKTCPLKDSKPAGKSTDSPYN